MIGMTPLESQADVVQAWNSYVSHPNFSGFIDGRPGRDLIEDDREVIAYVSDGRWVADCPQTFCMGGIACWPEHKVACCLDCGHVYKVKFPSKKTREEAELILSQRPLENQNWRPDLGEKVRMLAAENLQAQLGVPVLPEELT